MNIPPTLSTAEEDLVLAQAAEIGKQRKLQEERKRTEQLKLRKTCVHQFKSYKPSERHEHGDGRCEICGRIGVFDSSSDTWTKYYKPLDYYDCSSGCVCCNGVGTVYSDEERSDYDDV